MSFTLDICSELISAPLNKTCCKKAMLCGMFYAATIEASGEVQAELKVAEAAEKAVQILEKQFSATADTTEYTRAGRKYFGIAARSRALSNFLLSAQAENADIATLVGFRCSECAHSFLRGVFISCATVNDPHKGYHLEFLLENAERANALRAFISSDFGSSPKRVVRKSKTGIYYKTNAEIVDLLYYIGASRASFDMANICIERDIRSAENRATNCVARNIGRSVDASMKQVEAIEELMRFGFFDTLSDELKYTAQLRRENPDTSLCELAELHDPPISKSGLNRRLCKLMSLVK